MHVHMYVRMDSEWFNQFFSLYWDPKEGQTLANKIPRIPTKGCTFLHGETLLTRWVSIEGLLKLYVNCIYNFTCRESYLAL
jgi:hypothetical protein